MRQPEGSRPVLRPELAWSTWRQAAWLVVCGRTRRPALRIALLVGTLLSLINQGGVLLDGDAGWATVVRIASNYAIPYLVSSIALLSACRVPADQPPHAPRGPAG